MATYTVITKTGGSFVLTDVFIVGDGFAGDCDGRTIYVSEDDVESVRKHGV